MAGEPNQAKWFGVRPTDPEEPFTVIQGTAANLKVEAAIAAAQTITVTQATPANLKATVVGDDSLPLKVKQDTAANLKTTTVRSYVGQDSVTDLVVDPGAGGKIVDTGQLFVGRYDVTFTVSASAGPIFFRLGHINAINTLYLSVSSFFATTHSPVIFTILNWNMLTNERFGIHMIDAIVGSVTGSIWWTRRTS